MRSNSLALAVSAFTLIAVAGCGDDDNPPGNDAGPGMDAGVGDAGVAPVDTGVAPVDTGAVDALAPTCANVGDVCTTLACCAPNVCVDRFVTSICQTDVPDGGMCMAEGASCSLGSVCCPGTICLPSGVGGFRCSVETGLDAAMACGGLGAPCDAMFCCPGLVCAPRGPGMFCLDRA